MTDARTRPRQHHDVTDLVDSLLERGIAHRATDIHFEPAEGRMCVRLRIDGQLLDVDEIPQALAPNVVARLKVLASLLTYRTDIPQEGSLQWPPTTSSPGAALNGSAPDAEPRALDRAKLHSPVRPAAVERHATNSPHSTPEGIRDLRVATFPTIRGERAVVRIFRQSAELQSLDELGMAPGQIITLQEAVEQPAGLVVVAGPAGSGKTTTLYALLHHLRDRFPQRSLITLEDPVERRIDRVTQIQINPYGELDYERCLRSLLRQDPQVLLVGEVRDGRTADVVIQAALTGHLILTTLHSQDPASAIVRFLEMGIPAYQLVSTLTTVCAQRLIRKRCPACACDERASCSDCLGTGYLGQTAIAQVCRMDEALRVRILGNAPASQLRQMLAAQRPTLHEQGRAAVQAGLSTTDEVQRVLGCGESWP